MDTFNNFFKESNEFYDFENIDLKAHIDLLDLTWMNMEVRFSTPSNKLTYFDFSMISKSNVKDSIDELDSNSENSISFKEQPFVEVGVDLRYKGEKLMNPTATVGETLGTPTNLASNEARVIKSHRSLDLYNSSQREDVLNKGAIRAIRKYFRNEFKIKYKSLIKRRICNLEPIDVIVSCEEFCREIFPSSVCNKDLFCYVAGILKLCDVRKLNCSETIIYEVEDFLNCVRSYSKIKFLDIFESESLRILCNYAINNNIYPEKSYWLKTYLECNERGRMI